MPFLNQSWSLVNRGCTFEMPDGRLCRASAIRGERYCYMHDPERAEEAAEARRLGGLRRKRERTLAGAYELTGVRTLDELFRVVEIAVFDLFALENSIPRARALLHAADIGFKFLRGGEVEARLAILEAAVRPGARRADEFDGGLLGGSE